MQLCRPGRLVFLRDLGCSHSLYLLTPKGQLQTGMSLLMLGLLLRVLPALSLLHEDQIYPNSMEMMDFTKIHFLRVLFAPSFPQQ